MPSRSSNDTRCYSNWSMQMQYNDTTKKSARGKFCKHTLSWQLYVFAEPSGMTCCCLNKTNYYCSSVLLFNKIWKLCLFELLLIIGYFVAVFLLFIIIFVFIVSFLIFIFIVLIYYWLFYYLFYYCLFYHLFYYYFIRFLILLSTVISVYITTW